MLETKRYIAVPVEDMGNWYRAVDTKTNAVVAAGNKELLMAQVKVLNERDNGE